MNFRAHTSTMSPQRQADLRFALGALVALAVLAAFVLSLHLLAS